MMMILRWIGFALAIMLTAWIIPGISVENFVSALLVAVIIGLINVFIRPILMFITLPINVLTLGLFALVVNALLLMLAGYIAPGFEVDGFLSALLGSILLSIFSVALNSIGPDV